MHVKNRPDPSGKISASQALQATAVLGPRIRKRRRKLGLTLKSVADRAGLSVGGAGGDESGVIGLLNAVDAIGPFFISFV